MGRLEPRVVCVGGGHGLWAALRAARTLTPNVAAVVTVADDGGSSGILRGQLGIPAPGDLRMAIAALAGDPERERLLQYRFKEGELAGHPLGNLLIAALTDLRGDFARAVEEVAGLASVAGRVLPSTTEPVRLCAAMGGAEVRGQVAIARGDGPVERLWLEPAAAAYPGAAEAIADADLLVLGPGSLFTSIVAAILPLGITEAASRAGRVAFVLNMAEQDGETRGLDAAGHVEALRAHAPGLRIDGIIVHDGSLEGIVHPIGVAPGASIGAPPIFADVRGRGWTHDPEKLAAVFKGLLA